MAKEIDVLWIARYDYEAGAQLSPHRHDFFQLIYALAGEASAKADGEALALKGGDLWIIGPGTEHRMQVDDRRGFRTLDVKFRVHDEELGRALARLPAVLAFGRAGVVLEEIRREGLERRFWFRRRCSTLLLDMLIDCLRSAEIEAETATEDHCLSGPVFDDEVCRSLCEVIERNLAGSLGRRELASRTGYSYAVLAERCRRAFGMSPVQLLTRLRIEHACRLIQYSDWELKQIAARVGFKTVHHFTRRFTEIMGRTPAAWRKMQHEGICRDVYIDDRFVNQNLTIYPE